MYEFTHGGIWFKWEALDGQSRRLAVQSLAAAIAAGGPIGFALGFETGYRLTSAAHQVGLVVAYLPALAWFSVVMLAISTLFWWRFSLRQDEMFNRIQNWALGMSGAWTMALLAAWEILALAGAAPPVGPVTLIVSFTLALIGFWLIAVRRWA